MSRRGNCRGRGVKVAGPDGHEEEMHLQADARDGE